MLTHPTGLFSGDYISALSGVLSPHIFTHTLQPLNCIFGLNWGAGGPQVGLCPIFLVLVLFRHRISELAWPIAVELSHMIDIWLNFIMQVQKLGRRAASSWALT